MRRTIVLMLFLAMCFTTIATVPLNEVNFSNVNSGRFNQYLRGWIDTLNTDIRNAGVSLISNMGTGKIFYVDSSIGSDTNVGTKPEWAMATFNGAIGLCEDYRGDVVIGMQGHNESLIAADAVDVDIAGVMVVGLGRGSLRPRLDYDVADGEFVIGAPDVMIVNLAFMPGVNIVTHAIDVENAGDYAVIVACEFLDGEAAGTDEFVDTIQVGTTATDPSILYNKYFSTGTDSNNFVDLSAAAIVNPTVVGNRIRGAFAEAGIWGAAAVPTNCYITDNTVTQTTASQFCIEFQGAATGIAEDNTLNATTIGFHIDPGSISQFNTQCRVIGTTDLDSSPAFPPEDTAGNILGYDDADNVYASTNVVANADGSVLERIEFVQAQPATDAATNYLGVDDAANLGTTASVVPDHDGSALERLEAISQAAVPTYNTNNYFAVVADMTSATWNTVAAHEIATVTGACRVQILIETTATVITVGTNGTMEFGYAGNTAAIFSATALDAALTNDVWSAVYGSAATTVIGGADAKSALTSALFDVVVVGGVDIGYTVATNAGTTGNLTFHVWWTPLDATGAVAAGAGGVL